MKIEIYTRPGCGYCTNAKRLFLNMGLEFTEYDVANNPKMITTMQERTAGRTFPQIFIEDKPIGGFTDLISPENIVLLTNI
ncbi:glutaredoxin [Shewanella sp. SG41-4]|uniref:glutaredoxin domain-containing protein n=1 Tax=Shewanella sp. SG41-4 TaxID=2760976 RepID=UPI001602E34B|nr:glutaredoxin domain-containing protein [Shewanella sp. SG41-4]MBB1440981.1 glutaredoxin [Shewanella sp. SG41-4]